MKAFENWLYETNDWILYAITCCLVLGCLYVFLRWMFNPTELEPETRRMVHGATEE
jgi:hypothetical protein